MKQIRASVTYDGATGKIASAVLQERNLEDDTPIWKDVRPLEVAPDGSVTLFAAEPSEIKYLPVEVKS
jgi:hypothetical protein